MCRTKGYDGLAQIQTQTELSSVLSHFPQSEDTMEYWTALRYVVSIYNHIPMPGLSIVFICQENPRRSGISHFPDHPRVCRLMKTINRRHPDNLGWSGTNPEDKPSFHMSGKSQTIGDFAVSRPSKILPTYRKIARCIS